MTSKDINDIDFNNFFKEIIELDPEDPDFVEDVLEVERTSSLSAVGQFGSVTSGKLLVGALGGTLRFSVDTVGGSGSCPKKGTGAFTGKPVPQGLTGGTYKLYFTRVTATLELYSGGRLVHTYKGTGGQKGLSNCGGKPWEGNWK